MAAEDLPSPPRDRVYGRISGAFVVACPTCGTLIEGGGRKRWDWNPHTSEVRCSNGHVWIVGLALRRPWRGPRRASLPMDQVPDADALRQLREAERARKAEGARRHAEGATDAGKAERVGGRVWQANLAPECTCGYGEPPLQHVRVWVNPACARHGQGEGV